MPIDLDSRNNFQRGAAGDAFLGIATTINGAVILYLALVQPAAGAAAIPQARFSTLRGVQIPPVAAHGGHVTLANAAGLAQVMHNGAMAFDAIGFSIVKTGAGTFNLGTIRSGLNTNYAGVRTVPPGTPPADVMRYMPDNIFQNSLLPLLHELTQAIAVPAPAGPTPMEID